jgi:hypothetical protein
LFVHRDTCKKKKTIGFFFNAAAADDDDDVVVVVTYLPIDKTLTHHPQYSSFLCCRINILPGTQQRINKFR